MRNGISREVINNVKQILNTIFRSGLNTSQAVEQIKDDLGTSDEARIILEFIGKTKRGIFKHFKFNG